MRIYLDGDRVIITRADNHVEVRCNSAEEARDLAFRLALAAANEGIE